MKPAFSTVTCPNWTLDRVVARAEQWGYLGVELRSFGYGSTQFACDPALTGAAKIKSMFDRAGVEPMCVATSVRFDDPVTPPIIGEIFFDHDKSVRQVKGAIDLAARIGAPFVRVFAFEIIGQESRSTALGRICERLSLAADAARNSGVRLLIENGGSFNTAADLAEIIDRVGNPLLAASYHAAVARSVGEDPLNGVNVLGENVCCVKLSDFHGGKAVALGKGDLGVGALIGELANRGFPGWLVYEHPAAWLGGEEQAESVLEAAAVAMYEFMGRSERPAALRAASAAQRSQR